ncbi:acylneuraminate cytidylyltransferase family protein [Pelagibacterales bacterium SAG-MED47]|nr:acylneuraminate cytidylyltransferase family protein [Pelagibacterales bacterium SAG-MED47]
MSLNYAFIFARGGSKGIKNKNIRLFNGKPLIYYSIKLAKKISSIKKVFVSSDNKKILDIAKKFGAETILRPKSIAKDNSPEIEAWKHAVNYLKKKKDYFDNFICLPCTSPLRISKDIILALKKIKNNNDIVLGISATNKSPNFNMVKKFRKRVKLLSKKKILHSRQEADKTYNLTTIIYACRYKYILNIRKSFWDGNVKYIEIPKIRSIDIDDIIDFRIAEFIYKNKKKMKLKLN